MKNYLKELLKVGSPEEIDLMLCQRQSNVIALLRHYGLCVCTAEYQDHYKLLLQSPHLAKRYVIDLSNKSPAFLNTLYTPKGRLIKKDSAVIIHVIEFTPSSTSPNSIFDFSIIQEISDPDTGERLALLKTFYKWNSETELIEAYTQDLVLEP